MKVNMTPNPLDVVTIHASQGDTEARQWGFELHNNGEKIDSSSISNQMVFKAYEGGTEQLLPENGSVPVTAPFLGDIRYPQGLLTDQEFTYRESPTESDGLAWIKSIKGNTIVWNQLVPIDWVSTRTFSDGLSVTNNNDGTYTISGTASQSRFPTRNTEIYGIQGHKYLIQVSSSQNKAVISQNGSSVYVYDKVIYTAQNNNAFIIYFNANTYNNEKIIPMIIDLTKMGLDISSPSEFTSLFPLPYYDYNAGTLLSFNGSGLKTVGKNLFDENSILLSQGFVKQNDGSYYKDNLATLSKIIWKNNAHINDALNIKFKYKNIKATGPQGLRIIVVYTDGTRQVVYSPVTLEFTLLQCLTNSSKMVDQIVWDYGSALNGTYIKDFIISVDNISYEPYTSSTLSLPISTYFPTGMKSAGNVYDELTETKAITRIGTVDLGSLNWTRWTNGQDAVFLSYSISGFKATETSIPKCAKYEGVSVANDNMAAFNKGDKTICYRYPTFDRIYIRDDSFTTEVDFKASLSGVYLYYELATSTETSFSTASLVTENAEIPLSNNDGTLIGKCTEQLSAEPGFHDAKIKLSDGDGTCYSNKLQLHVERSPQ